MKKFVHPLPLTFFSLNSAIFTFKKMRREAEDNPSDNGETDYYGGELNFKGNGDIDFDSGKGGIMTGALMDEEDREMAEGVIASNTKKIEEMSGSIQDINTRLDKFDVTMKGIRSDSDGLREEIVQINDSMKKMLCIYEAITQQYNPFIDDVPTRRPGVPVPEANVGVNLPEEEPIDRIITPEDLVEDAPTLADVLGLNAKRCEPAPRKVQVLPVKTEPPSVSNDRVTVRLFEDTVTVSPANRAQDFQSACRDRIYGMLRMMDERTEMDQALDRIFNRRLEGKEAPKADLDLLMEWLNRAKE
jgi:outer membrane murein-binding lipoprotein Lpp